MYKVYTDGSCSKNGAKENTGACAAIILDEKGDKVLDTVAEKFYDTTNNRMELMAIIKGLEYFKFPTQIEVYSDSEYVVKMINSWISIWKKNKWKLKSTGADVKNLDLVKKLYDLLTYHKKVHGIWVKGHAGNKYNEMADELCQIMQK